MHRITFGLIVLLGIMTVTSAIPHHHRDDPYGPAIEFLKQLRKARKHSGGGSLTGGILGNREEGQIQSPTASESQTSTPILFPSQSSNSNSAPSFGSGGGSGSSSSGSDGDRINIQLPANFPQLNRPPSSPADIMRINSGVSTILSGVRSFDLGQILRGAFIFPANDNVKSVANNVLDSIFGPAGGQPPTQN